MEKSKIFGVGLAMMMAFPLSAQNFTVGPEIGYERVQYKISGSKHTDVATHSGNGIRVGAIVVYTFSNNLFLQSGLYYSYRGGTYIYGIDDSHRLPYVKDIHLKTTECLTLPIAVGYEIPFCSKWGIGIEAGGYIASGLGGGSSFFRCANGEGSAGEVFDDSHFTVAIPDSDRRENVMIKGSDRIDAGCFFGAHVRFNSIRLRASYQLGLCQTIYDMAIPRTFTLSLSYDFKL